MACLKFHLTERGSQSWDSHRRLSLVVAVLSVLVLHFASLIVVFMGAVASAGASWDSACDVPLEENGYNPGYGYASKQSAVSYYFEPGFTCEVLIEGEWLVLRKDMPGARNLVLAITAVGVILAAAIKDPITALLFRSSRFW